MLRDRTTHIHSCDALIETPSARYGSLFLHVYESHTQTEYSINRGLRGREVLFVVTERIDRNTWCGRLPVLMCGGVH